ncbi:hypothetical protein CCAX7_51340 [Capsulimonas corticalis]|uniref:Uncharacterized protein n=1 Tax=Capsulimonas corticalis TaxID=2219043 RepID=A0A402CPG2_9BACT|nr:family 43 glycosylhydrolase [Capsulimonas corticalis]BDI33083.1 hypothetical protein CCAX7_51340 [Capsulimonas corticalis]
MFHPLKRKLTLMIAAPCLALGLAAAPSHAGTYTNPIVTGAADPFITYANGSYYLLSTSLSNDIRIWHSPSLATLGSGPPASVYNTGGFYESAEMYTFNGLWYIYYTQYPNSIDVLESDSGNPIGSYHFKAQLTNNTYDGSLLKMPNGQLYLMGSTYGNIVIQPMSNPYTVSGGQSSIAHIDQGWESGVIEAPEAVWRNGQLNIVYSSGGYNQANYAVGSLHFNGGDPTSAGSYTKLGGPLFTGNPGAGVNDAGVASPFLSPDGTQTYFCYSDYPSQGAPDSQRSILAQPMSFDGANNPVFGTAIGPGQPIQLPSGDPGNATGIVNGALYSLTNVASGFALDDTAWGTTAGTQIELWDDWGGAPQQWRFTLQPDGAYTLTTSLANMNIDDPNGSNTWGQHLQLWAPNGATPQEWRVTRQADGAYTLINVAAGLALDDPNGAGPHGTLVQLWPANGATAQEWRLTQH